MHIVPLTGYAVYHQAVIVQVIEHKLVLAFLLGAFTQLFLEGTYLAFLDGTLYQAVITRYEYYNQEQRKHNPVFVLT